MMENSAVCGNISLGSEYLPSPSLKNWSWTVKIFEIETIRREENTQELGGKLPSTTIRGIQYQNWCWNDIV